MKGVPFSVRKYYYRLSLVLCRDTYCSAGHHVELTLQVWIMLYSLISLVTQVNMYVVLDELLEVLGVLEKHSFL